MGAWILDGGCPGSEAEDAGMPALEMEEGPQAKECGHL